jgi:hypothetical protein
VAAQAATPREGRFEGTTSQDRAVNLRVGEGGDVVRVFGIRRLLDCGGDTVSGTFRQRGALLVRRGGRFSGRGRVRGARGSQVDGGRFELSGRFVTPRRVTGVYRERTRLRDDRLCRTGEVTFTARAQP